MSLGTSGKESACQCRRCKRHSFDPWVWKRKRKRQPTPVFVPGKSGGQRSLVGYRPWGLKESDATEHAHTCVVWFCQKVPLCTDHSCGVLHLALLSSAHVYPFEERREQHNVHALNNALCKRIYPKCEHSQHTLEVTAGQSCNLLIDFWHKVCMERDLCHSIF